jgi:hypothetical protein
MLYIGPNTSKPKRVQGVFISDKETNNIVKYIKDQGEADYVEGVIERQSGSIATGGSSFSDDDGDALLPDAKDVIRESGKASASLLQRRLKVGYARAARILDLLEDQGVIGPPDGAKPREVFLDKLGGTDAVEFSAKEHELTGELAPEDEEDEEEEEYGATEDDTDEEDVDTEDGDLEDEDTKEEEGEQEEEEQEDEEQEDEELEEVDEGDENKKQGKQEYEDDEWT